jgi:hypothetical protein
VEASKNPEYQLQLTKHIDVRIRLSESIKVGSSRCEQVRTVFASIYKIVLLKSQSDSEHPGYTFNPTHQQIALKRTYAFFI